MLTVVDHQPDGRINRTKRGLFHFAGKLFGTLFEAVLGSDSGDVRDTVNPLSTQEEEQGWFPKRFVGIVHEHVTKTN